MELPKKPQMTSYLSVFHYLEDVYKYRKETEASFTYEKWAEELGLKNRSFLRQLVSGRRGFTEATINIFTQRMQMDSSEKEYFYLLILYTKARSQTQRDLYGRKLRQLANGQYPQAIIEPAKNMVASILFPRVLAFLTFKDVLKTPEGVSQIFNISLDQAKESLETLKELGLVELQDGHWNATKTAYKVPEKIGDDDILNYHHKSLLNAIQAKTSPANERRYRSFILALNENEFLKFNEELNTLLTEMLGKFDVDHLQDRRIFQVNFNLHSASMKLERISESHD